MQMKATFFADRHPFPQAPLPPHSSRFFRFPFPGIEFKTAAAAGGVCELHVCGSTQFESIKQQRYWKRAPATGIDRRYERRIVRNSSLSILEGVG